MVLLHSLKTFQIFCTPYPSNFNFFFKSKNKLIQEQNPRRQRKQTKLKHYHSPKQQKIYKNPYNQ